MRRRFTYDIPINEDKVMETIAVSKSAFLSGEAEQMVSPGEFLFLQSSLIQKRWWFLQGLLLAFVCLFSYSMDCGVYGLLGVNGAGKTTLMRMLTTLMKPTSGIITWDGEDIMDMDGKYGMLLGYLPQDFGYYPDFSVYDYLMYIAALKGIRPAVARQRVKELLKQVGLVKARNKKMKTLSGGMKRRAGIAQAMLNDPKILILDEPTDGLDPSERIRFRNLISELSDDRIDLSSSSR